MVMGIGDGAPACPAGVPQLVPTKENRERSTEAGGSRSGLGSTDRVEETGDRGEGPAPAPTSGASMAAPALAAASFTALAFGYLF